jgi:cell division septal protein FtsQ
MRARKRLVKKPRDAQERREEARRFATKVSKIILAVAAVLTLVVVANRWGASEKLERVRIVGRVVLDSSEIMERAGIGPQTSLRKLDLRAVENRIATHPFLSHVAVYRDAQGTLVVEVVERAPVAMSVLGGVPVYLDSQAVALPYRFSRATVDVPIVRGIERADTAAAGGAAPGMLLDSLRALESLGVVRAIRDFDESVYRQISEVVRAADGSYTLISADGAIPIRAGLAADVPARLPKLDLFMRTALATHRGRPRYVDLRWRGQVVVRWSGGDNVSEGDGA